MEEAGVGVLPFFPALAAYVLTLHDAQTKVGYCRRTAASKDIEGGMGICGCDSDASVTFRPLSPIFHLDFLLPPQLRPRNSSAR